VSSSQSKSVSEHACIKAANEKLAARNTCVDVRQTFNFSTETEGERLLVATMKVDGKKRGKALAVFATYCPFCGDKLP